MGQVTFTTVFSGGKGTLIVMGNDSTQILKFTDENQGPKTMDLDIGHQFISVSGSSPEGDHQNGNIELTISGDVDTEVVKNLPSGHILPQSIMISVTKKLSRNQISQFTLRFSKMFIKEDA